MIPVDAGSGVAVASHWKTMVVIPARVTAWALMVTLKKCCCVKFGKAKVATPPPTKQFNATQVLFAPAGLAIVQPPATAIAPDTMSETRRLLNTTPFVCIQIDGEVGAFGGTRPLGFLLTIDPYARRAETSHGRGGMAVLSGAAVELLRWRRRD